MSSFVKFHAILLSVFIAFSVACSDGKTGIAALKVSKDLEGKTEAVVFKGGETLFASAILANAPTKGKIIFSIKNEKGAILPGTEFKVDLINSATTSYKAQIAEKATPGKYILTADMHDGNGEKKDTKSTPISIEPPA